MSTHAKTSFNAGISVGLLRRINILHPALKIILPAALMLLFLGSFSFYDDLIIEISRAPIRSPMLIHSRATERSTMGKKLVALTFDDGPSPLVTPSLLDILREKDVVATFFIIGEKAERNADIIRRAYNTGHEIASHTMHHQNLLKLDRQQIQSNIEDSVKSIASVSGANINLTRPPYGNTNNDVLSCTTTPLINWSVDTLDWQSQNPDAVIATALSQVHDGAIILMHDIYQSTADSIPTLIDMLRQDGYEFVTVSELARERKVKLSVGQVYYKFAP